MKEFLVVTPANGRLGTDKIIHWFLEYILFETPHRHPVWLWATWNQFPAHSLPDDASRHFHFFLKTVGRVHLFGSQGVCPFEWLTEWLPCVPREWCASLVPSSMPWFLNCPTSSLYPDTKHIGQACRSHHWEVTHFQLCYLNLSFTIKTWVL